MAGHSKWSNIKRRKGAADKKKAKIFSRLSKEIILAVKNGGADQEKNSRLKTAIISAKAANMPNNNIERAIQKGLGNTGSSNLEEIVYEGYAPGGVAILLECLTDNKNRTAGEVREVLDKHSGKLADKGAVTWNFSKKSYFTVHQSKASEEDLLEILIDEGAESFEKSGEYIDIWGAVEAFEDISKSLEKAGIIPDEARLSRYPENTVKINDIKTAEKVFKILEKMEDLDDIQHVYSNFDIPDEIINKLS